MRTITTAQLKRAIDTAPNEVKRDGQIFLQRGLSEYKRVAVQSAPWRVGQSGGGIPRDTGNLREKHKTKISGLRGTFGVSDQDVKYAKYVHGGSKPTKVKGRNIKTRPWLNYAMNRADTKVQQHYNTFLDSIFKHIAN